MLCMLDILAEVTKKEISVEQTKLYHNTKGRLTGFKPGCCKTSLW